MRDLRRIIVKNQWTQAEAAKQCGVSQPRVNDLLKGKFNKFSIDALVNMAGSMGMKIHVEFGEA
jgi:predicted XRE-type DNA-binding protein